MIFNCKCLQGAPVSTQYRSTAMKCVWSNVQKHKSTSEDLKHLVQTQQNETLCSRNNKLVFVCLQKKRAEEKEKFLVVAGTDKRKIPFQIFMTSFFQRLTRQYGDSTQIKLNV